MILARYLLIFAPKVMTNSELARQSIPTHRNPLPNQRGYRPPDPHLLLPRHAPGQQPGRLLDERNRHDCLGRCHRQRRRPLPSAPSDHSKTFCLGSHLDYLRGAGKFDGSLGILIALACVEHLPSHKIRLPFDSRRSSWLPADGDGGPLQKPPVLGSRCPRRQDVQ